MKKLFYVLMAAAGIGITAMAGSTTAEPASAPTAAECGKCKKEGTDKGECKCCAKNGGKCECKCCARKSAATRKCGRCAGKSGMKHRCGKAHSSGATGKCTECRNKSAAPEK